MNNNYTAYLQRMAAIRHDAGRIWSLAKDDNDFLRLTDMAERERQEKNQDEDRITEYTVIYPPYSIGDICPNRLNATGRICPDE